MSGPSRTSYILLGMMTLVSFGGPFLIAALLRGGERAGWPPDRPLEWVGFSVVMTLFTVCFIACLSLGLWRKRDAGGPRQDR